MSSSILSPKLLRPLALLLGAVTGHAAASADYADRIGVMTHFAQGWDIAVIDRLEQAGLRHVRDELYWDVVEAERGRFVFPARYTAYMGGLRERQIAPLIALTFGNRHYDEGLTPYTEAGFEAYARYCVEVLRHHGSQIKAVEIWNEYNGSFATGPATQDRAGTYLKMLRVAYAAIKRERPDVVVLGAATSGLPMPYLERLFADGALDHMDAVSIHPYQTRETPEGLDERVAALHALIARYSGGAAKPVWVTEIGWATRVSQAPGDLGIDENLQAAFLVRAYALLLSADVKRVYWYLFKDHHQFSTMGVVRDDRTFTPKPAYAALATLINRLAGVRAIVREPAPEDVYSLRLERDSGPPLRLLWAVRPTSLPLPAGVEVFDLLGASVSPAGVLALGASPVYLVGEYTPPGPEPATRELLADSVANFSLQQGAKGWSYGFFPDANAAFVPFTLSRTTDWKQEWIGPHRSLSVSADEQHPASNAGKAVAAVRRWTSTAPATVRVEGRFTAGLLGDGVRVRILADGETRFEKHIGGGSGRPVVAEFDFVHSLGAGGRLDFAVDPGPAGSPDHDATKLSATIHTP